VLLSGFQKFPVGVVSYLFWPTTTIVSRFTSTHHLWTIPLYIYAVDLRFDIRSWYMSIFVVVSHVMLSRWLTPFTLPLDDDMKGKAAKDQVKYLNVNLSHELWRGIKYPLPARFNMFHILIRWQIFNLIVYMILQFITNFAAPIFHSKEKQLADE